LAAGGSCGAAQLEKKCLTFSGDPFGALRTAGPVSCVQRLIELGEAPSIRSQGGCVENGPCLRCDQSGPARDQIESWNIFTRR
jgi:hypothetical protein